MQQPGKSYRIPESVLVVVFTRECQVLLLLRSAPGGFWQSVTGSRQAGESLVETAIREVREETSLPVENILDCRMRNRYFIDPAFRHRYAPDVHENLEYVFRLELEKPLEILLNPEEHCKYGWFEKRKSMNLCGSPSNMRMIDRWVGRGG